MEVKPLKCITTRGIIQMNHKMHPTPLKSQKNTILTHSSGRDVRIEVEETPEWGLSLSPSLSLLPTYSSGVMNTPRIAGLPGQLSKPQTLSPLFAPCYSLNSPDVIDVVSVAGFSGWVSTKASFLAFTSTLIHTPATNVTT